MSEDKQEAPQAALHRAFEQFINSQSSAKGGLPVNPEADNALRVGPGAALRVSEHHTDAGEMHSAAAREAGGSPKAAEMAARICGGAVRVNGQGQCTSIQENTSRGAGHSR